MLPGNGGTQRLPRLIGWSRALELMVTGPHGHAAEALELGIVNAVFPADELREKTLEYARGLASGATKAIGNIKLAVHEGLGAGLEAGLERERELVEELFRSEDGREGIAAFAEKRQPCSAGGSDGDCHSTRTSPSSATPPPGRRSGASRRQAPDDAAEAVARAAEAFPAWWETPAAKRGEIAARGRAGSARGSATSSRCS